MKSGMEFSNIMNDVSCTRIRDIIVLFRWCIDETSLKGTVCNVRSSNASGAKVTIVEGALPVDFGNGEVWCFLCSTNCSCLTFISLKQKYKRKLSICQMKTRIRIMQTGRI